MAFFSRYGSVYYTFDDPTKVYLLNDLTTSISVDHRFKIDPRLVLEYTIQDGDRPELLSNRLYSTPSYWWTVLLINNITNYDEQWPIPESDFDTYLESKYPLNELYDIHHYETVDGIITDPEVLMSQFDIATIQDAIIRFALQPITIYNYEFNRNEEKRKIVLIDPDYITNFDRQMKSLYS